MQDYIIITDDMLDDTYLEHYGVVGMHWHHRKAVAAAAKGDYKKMRKHLDKNIANNKKKNGFYYKRLEKVTDAEVRKYKNTASDRRKAKIAMGIAIGAPLAAATYSKVQQHKFNKTVNQRMQQQVDFENSFRRGWENAERRRSGASVSDAAEAVRRYQEAANRAASSLDNTRNKRKRR